MSKPSVLLAALLCLMVTAPSTSQNAPDLDDLDRSLELLSQGALQLHITARIVDQNEHETVWDMELSRVTIAGRAVSVRLDGSNITVVAEFTPYWEDDDTLVLVAQGQTWVRRDGDDQEDVQYRTAFTTMPIEWGEPVLFLPLGTGKLPVETEAFGRLNIELEINVEPYQS